MNLLYYNHNIEKLWLVYDLEDICDKKWNLFEFIEIGVLLIEVRKNCFNWFK